MSITDIHPGAMLSIIDRTVLTNDIDAHLRVGNPKTLHP